jgi:hypothetical protein
MMIVLLDISLRAINIIKFYIMMKIIQAIPHGLDRKIPQMAAIIIQAKKR